MQQPEELLRQSRASSCDVVAQSSLPVRCWTRTKASAEADKTSDVFNYVDMEAPAAVSDETTATVKIAAVSDKQETLLLAAVSTETAVKKEAAANCSAKDTAEVLDTQDSRTHIVEDTAAMLDKQDSSTHKQLHIVEDNAMVSAETAVEKEAAAEAAVSDETAVDKEAAAKAAVSDETAVEKEAAAKAAVSDETAVGKEAVSDTQDSRAVSAETAVEKDAVSDETAVEKEAMSDTQLEEPLALP